MCTIEGDIHSIGKDICSIMLKVGGYNVINLGKDVPLDTIVQACKDNDAVGVGTSALMTSTMVGQKTFEEKIVQAGLKGKCLTNVGGAPVSQQWADDIGADIYSESSNDIVSKFDKALSDAD
ncbi:cobalamin-dependent protein [Methanomassiliicoccales archaeon LGM-RCC1]|nr:cobalamin-dependent protein [Methanomassiliicoccales archaeon LGM-RCC1]